MKKFMIIVVICMVCLVLGSCDPGTYRFDYDDLAGSVTSLELIQYDNPGVKQFKSWLPNHESKLKDFDFTKMELLESLDEDKFDDFLIDLSEIKFLNKYYCYNSPKIYVSE